MSGRFAFGSDSLLCGFDGATTLMPKHHNQADCQVVDRVFDASQAVIVDHIAARVAAIAFFQARDCLSGRYNRLVWMSRIGGFGKLARAKQIGDNKKRYELALSHDPILCAMESNESISKVK